MNKKIFIPAIIAAVLLPAIVGIGYTTTLTDTHTANDDKITSHIMGSYANMTEIEHAASAELIFLGTIESLEIVEEYPHDDARYKWVMRYFEIQPTQVLKGTPVLNDNGNIVLRVPGGETENTKTVYEYLPLSENDDVFMYLGMNAGETIYIPSGEETYVVRDGMARDYHGDLVDADTLVKKHKKIISELP